MDELVLQNSGTEEQKKPVRLCENLQLPRVLRYLFSTTINTGLDAQSRRNFRTNPARGREPLKVPVSWAGDFFFNQKCEYFWLSFFFFQSSSRNKVILNLLLT